MVAQSMSRRQMLRTLSASSLLLCGGAVLSACGGDAQTTNITLLSAGWPVSAMPSAADQKNDPNQKAYATVLDAWLKKNPGITIKSVAVEIWDPQKLSIAVSSGTASSWYPSAVLGSYSNEKTRTAFINGMAADITALSEQHQLRDKLHTYVHPSYDSWKVNDKYYTIPYDYIAGDSVVFYRRDLFAQAGLKDPEPTWTWSEFRQIAKTLTQGNVKGVTLPPFGLDWILASQARDLLTTLPSPTNSWHWRYDYDTHKQRWLDAVALFRGMLNDDKSVIAAIGDDDPVPPFRTGEAAMTVLNTGFYTRPPSDPESFHPLADMTKKSLDEIIGMVSLPVGEDGYAGSTQPVLGAASFYPRLSQTALQKAYDLYLYMVAGDGFKQQKTAVYNQSKNLANVYQGSVPAYDYGPIPGVPGTMEDAWGTKWYQSLQQILALPLIPRTEAYFPPERSGITADAYNDARSAWMFTTNDPSEALTKLQNTQEQQTASLSSGTPADQFKKSAERYYGDLDTFWQKHAPKFHSEVFKPWYQQKILPALR